MPHTVVSSPAAPAAVGPYSQAIGVDAGTSLLFLSGQIALDGAGSLVGGDDVAAQTRQVMTNIGHVLRAAGLGFGDVVKATIFMTDMADYGTVNTIYAEHFDRAPPARSAVEVAALPRGARVEIECIASRG